MPVTPLHLGPGMAIKAIAPRHFSIVTFGIAQVAIDIEPGLGMLFGWDTLHGWTHTYLGATLIAAATVIAGRPLAQAILAWWNAHLDPGLRWLASPAPITWVAAATGAFVGTYSHVALDSLMHADLKPFAPFDASNPLLYAVSLDTLHVGCVVAGAAGLALWAIRHRHAHGMP